MELTIINPPATLWDTKSNSALDALTVYGYSVYSEIGDEENTAKWHYVIYANGQPQEIDIPYGFAFSHNVPPNAGFSDVGTNLDLARSDTGLLALFTYIGLDGNNITFQDLDGLNLESIDPKDFTLKKSTDGRVITIAAQPYELVTDNDIVIKDNNEGVYDYKTHLL